MLFGTAKPIALTLGVAAVLAVGGAAVPLTALASDSSPTTGAEPTPSESPSSDPTPTQSATPTPTPTPTPTSTPTDSPTPTPSDSPPTADPPPASQPSGGQATGGSISSRSGTTSALRAPNVPARSLATLMHAMPARFGVSGASAALPFAPASGVPPLTAPGVQPRLPMVGAPPEVAPRLGQQGTPTALRAAESPLGMDDTTYRLVLTQLAWLSALLVFMAVLLTQLRLKRRRLRPGTDPR